MEIVYGVEINNGESITLTIEEITNVVHLIDYSDTVLITATQDAAEIVQTFLNELDLYENTLPLIALNRPKLFNLWSDYGFLSINETYYLFFDDVIPFRVEGNNQHDLQMALFQLEEFCIAIDRGYLFIDRQWRDLVQKIATAYRVKITFFTSTK